MCKGNTKIKGNILNSRSHDIVATGWKMAFCKEISIGCNSLPDELREKWCGNSCHLCLNNKGETPCRCVKVRFRCGEEESSRKRMLENKENRPQQPLAEEKAHPQHDQAAINRKIVQSRKEKFQSFQEQVYRLSEENRRLKNDIKKQEEEYK